MVLIIVCILAGLGAGIGTGLASQCGLRRQFLYYDIYYGRSVSCKTDYKDNIKDG